jgi:hypothetical protein
MGVDMDDKTAKRFQSKARQAQLARDDFVKAAVTTVQGREYLAWVMGLGRPNDNPFAGNALATSFRCGEANISKQIELHVLKAAPKGYFQILEDQQKEDFNDRTSDDTSDASDHGYAAEPDSASADTTGSAL